MWFIPKHNTVMSVCVLFERQRANREKRGCVCFGEEIRSAGQFRISNSKNQCSLKLYRHTHTHTDTHKHKQEWVATYIFL